MAFFTVLQLLTAGTAMLCDLRDGRIPNILVLTAAVTGLAGRIRFGGITEIFVFLAGCTVPLILLLPLFRFRMMGAGDIKLFMSLGGIVGFPGILRLMFWSFAAGGVYALLKMVFVTGIKERFRYFLRYFQDLMHSGRVLPYRLPGNRPENFPFAVPVFAAVVLTTFL